MAWRFFIHVRQKNIDGNRKEVKTCGGRGHFRSFSRHLCARQHESSFFFSITDPLRIVEEKKNDSKRMPWKKNAVGRGPAKNRMIGHPPSRPGIVLLPPHCSRQLVSYCNHFNPHPLPMGSNVCKKNFLIILLAGHVLYCFLKKIETSRESWWPAGGSIENFFHGSWFFLHIYGQDMKSWKQCTG